MKDPGIYRGYYIVEYYKYRILETLWTASSDVQHDSILRMFNLTHT